jgi:beta-1,4-mannosyl-glycoprotein beta-1,4-N-acetylglucosaminyltransferase
MRVIHFKESILTSQMRRIIDTFTFFNELPMLLLRLTELNDVVDTFVLVEATITHSGLPKPLYFQENKSMFEKFLHKIIHVVVEDLPNLPETGTWDRETKQRTAIYRGLSQLTLEPEDLVIVSDIDEIPDSEMLKVVKEKGIRGGINCLYMDMYYYNTTCKMTDCWKHAKIMEFNKLNQNPDLNKIRLQYSYQYIYPAGWHFSFFGNVNMIRTKLESFAHNEWDNDYYKNPERIQKMISESKDLFERDFVPTVHIPRGTNPYLPKNKHLIPEAL